MNRFRHEFLSSFIQKQNGRKKKRNSKSHPGLVVVFAMVVRMSAAVVAVVVVVVVVVAVVEVEVVAGAVLQRRRRRRRRRLQVLHFAAFLLHVRLDEFDLQRRKVEAAQAAPQSLLGAHLVSVKSQKKMSDSLVIGFILH